MTDEDPSLLTQAAAKLKQRGFTQVTSARDLEENKGVTHCVFERNDTTYHCRAKAEVFRGLAGFGTDQIEKARKENAWLMIWFADTDTFWVFDTAYVDRHGDRNEGQSKRSEAREYVDIPLDAGVPLSHWDNGETPRQITEASTDDTTQGGLDQFL